MSWAALVRLDVRPTALDLVGAFALRIEDLLELLRQAGPHAGSGLSLGVAVPALIPSRFGGWDLILVHEPVPL